MAMRKENQQTYLENIARKCEAELSALHIPFASGIEYSVNRGAKSRWGQCKRSRMNGSYSININEELIEPSVLMGLKETIIHEILHSCPDCMNHGGIWKSYVREVNSTYGYNIKSTNTAADKGFSNEQIAEIHQNRANNRRVEDKHKYIMRCTECGGEIHQARMSKFIKHPEFYRCSKCGGTFERVK